MYGLDKKNKKNRYTPVNPTFTIFKRGMRGYTLHGHVFLMSYNMCTILFSRLFLCLKNQLVKIQTLMIKFYLVFMVFD